MVSTVGVHRSGIGNHNNQPRVIYNYTPTGGRIYLTESSGGVLGANVMRDHTIVFANHLVDFADGACDYHIVSKGQDGGSAAAEVCTSSGVPVW